MTWIYHLQTASKDTVSLPSEESTDIDGQAQGRPQVCRCGGESDWCVAGKGSVQKRDGDLKSVIAELQTLETE